jgi:hypothetical protein
VIVLVRNCGQHFHIKEFKRTLVLLFTRRKLVYTDYMYVYKGCYITLNMFSYKLKNDK